jgi:hypothetical protein
MMLESHIRKSGFIVHVSVTSKELVRVMTAILARVQFHISLLSPHCVSRCCVVSMASQVLHRFVSVSLIAARRSLVGMRSWITIYHVDCWTSKTMLCGGWSMGVSNLHRGICGRPASLRPSLYCYVCL